MKTFEFTALDGDGKSHTGAVISENGEVALRRVKEMRLFPTKVVEKTQSSKKKELTIKPGSRISAKRLCAFTRQLATLLEAGLPMLRSLHVLRQQEEDRGMRRTLENVILSIESGSTLSEALAQHPKTFNRLYINMVKAGEVSGTMDVVLTRLAEFMEKAERIKGKIIAGMFYPIAVLVVAGAILAILMVVVIPKFKTIFEGGLANGRPMPPFTVMVLSISDLIRLHFLGTLIFLGGLIGAFRVGLATAMGRRIFDRFKLIAPVIGPVVRKVTIARMSRTLGTLVQNGVPILQSLNISRETAGNTVVSQAIENVHESVKSGEAIATPLASSGIFPALVVNMVDVGEKSGNLPEMLLKVADRFDEESDNAVAALTSLLEPIMIVLLAIVVGSIVIAMFLPLIAIMEGFDQNPGKND